MTLIRGATGHSAGYWVLLASISAASMAFVMSSSLNVALPAIQRELGARGADLIWIPNAYVLVQASLIVVTGSLGDHFGRNRVCIAGIALFGAASIVCGFAPSTAWLILGRFAQGVGSAMIIPNSLAIVAAHFSTEGQGWALGIWSAITVFMTGVAPFLGGVLADAGAWRLIFLIHIPLGAAAAIFLARRVPETCNRQAKRRMSMTGALLIVFGLGGITFGFIESSGQAIDSWITLGAIVGGLLALAIFLRDEGQGKHAILPLRLFRSRTFSASNFITLALHGFLGPAIIYLPLNMIQVQGYSATTTGLAVMPMTVLATLVSAAVGPVVDRRGPLRALTLGLLIVMAGFALFAVIGVTGGEAEYFSTFFPPIALFGVGLGLCFAPLTVAAMHSAPQHNAGIASGVNNTMSRAGQVLVVGILGGLAIAGFGQLLLEDASVRALPAEARAALAADAGDLAETRIPDSLSEEQRMDTREAIRQAFVQVFSILMWCGAAAMALCAAVAWLFIDERELDLNPRS